MIESYHISIEESIWMCHVIHMAVTHMFTWIIDITHVAATQRLLKWTDIRALYSEIKALNIIALYAKPAFIFILMHISTCRKTRAAILTSFCGTASCSDIRALYPDITPLSKKVQHTNTFILINMHTCSKAHFRILTSFYKKMSCFYIRALHSDVRTIPQSPTHIVSYSFVCTSAVKRVV